MDGVSPPPPPPLLEEIKLSNDANTSFKDDEFLIDFFKAAFVFGDNSILTVGGMVDEADEGDANYWREEKGVVFIVVAAVEEDDDSGGKVFGKSFILCFGSCLFVLCLHRRHSVCCCYYE